jgi:hypothetical protein
MMTGIAYALAFFVTLGGAAVTNLTPGGAIPLMSYFMATGVVAFIGSLFAREDLRRSAEGEQR